MITLANSILLPKRLDLEMLESEYKGGNKEALAVAIHLCGRRGLLLPAWVTDAWKKACYDIVDREVEGWDDVLGKNRTAGQRARDLIKNQKKQMILWRKDIYKEIPTSSNKKHTIRVGNKNVPDRFGQIAIDLTADGKVHGVWHECSRREAKTLWYELFPSKTKSK